MLTATIFEDLSLLTTDQLGRLCTVDVQRIVALVEEGILTVDCDPRGEWRFDANCLRRARTALRLQNDLGLNLAGAALAVELLDEIASLRHQLSMTR